MTDEERVSMRDYLEGKVEDLRREFLAGVVDLRREIQSEVNHQKEAVAKAERTMNERLAGMNEFRDTLRDQAGRFITSDRLEEIKLALEKRLTYLELQMSNWQGRLVVLGAVWSVVIIVVTALINYFIRTISA
jgi:hypothetical protein